MKDSSMKKFKKAKTLLDTCTLSETIEMDSDVTSNGHEHNTKNWRKHIKDDATQDESFSVLSSKKKKGKKLLKVEAIEENQSESFFHQVNEEEIFKTDDSDSDNSDKRKKIKLVQEMEVSPEIGLKVKKNRKKKKLSLIDIDMEPSEEKKSKRKKSSEKTQLMDDSSENDTILINVRFAGQLEKPKHQSCLAGEEQNGDSFLNDSKNGGRDKRAKKKLMQEIEPAEVKKKKKSKNSINISNDVENEESLRGSVKNESINDYMDSCEESEINTGRHKRKKLKLMEEIGLEQVSPEIETEGKKRRKRKKTVNSTDELEDEKNAIDIVKHELIDYDAELIGAEKSESVSNKLKSKRNNNKSKLSDNSSENSNILVNVKVEGKKQKSSFSGEEQNGDSVLESSFNDSINGEKRAKKQLKQELEEVSSVETEIQVKKRRKSKKSINSTDDVENEENPRGMVKNEVIGDDVEQHSSDESVIILKKSKRDSKNHSKTEETFVANVKHHQDSSSEEEPNKDNSLNDSKNGETENPVKKRRKSKKSTNSHDVESDSEIEAKKPKKKSKKSWEDSSENEEDLVENDKAEGKQKRQKRQLSSCSSEEGQNGDLNYSSLDDSESSDKKFEYNLPQEIDKMFWNNNCFEVDFDVPKLHTLLDRASKPTPKLRQLLTSLGLTVKQGKYSKQEDAQIMENWKYFIKVNGLENKPSVFFRLDKRYMPISSKRNFLYYIARNMPERSPFGVYKRFKLLFQELKTGRYTASEDEIIIEAIRQQRGNLNLTELAATLQRSSLSVYKRATLLKQNSTRRIKWRLRNKATFIKYLLKITRIKKDKLAMLQHRTITTEEWTKLSAKLDGYPAKKLQRVWFEYIYPSLFIPVDLVDVRQVKIALIDLMVQNNETDWKVVDWSHYESHFPGLTSAKLYLFMRQLMNVFVPKEKWTNLKKCLKLLKTKTLDDIAPQTIFKMKYVNGRLEYVTKNCVEEIEDII